MQPSGYGLWQNKRNIAVLLVAVAVPILVGIVVAGSQRAGLRNTLHVLGPLLFWGLLAALHFHQRRVLRQRAGELLFALPTGSATTRSLVRWGGRALFVVLAVLVFFLVLTSLADLQKFFSDEGPDDSAFAALRQFVMLALWCLIVAPFFWSTGNPELQVREHGLLITLPPQLYSWERVANYYWRPEPPGWKLVLKYCGTKPGVVDNTFVVRLALISPAEQDKLDQLLRENCGKETEIAVEGLSRESEEQPGGARPVPRDAGRLE